MFQDKCVTLQRRNIKYVIMQQNISVNIPVTFNYWDLVKSMSNDAKRSLIVLLQQSLNASETDTKAERMSFSEAKTYLSQHKLQSKGVPADFNGMRNEVNPKYL